VEKWLINVGTKLHENVNLRKIPISFLRRVKINVLAWIGIASGVPKPHVILPCVGQDVSCAVGWQNYNSDKQLWISVSSVITERLIIRSNQPHIVRVKKSMLKKDNRFLNIRVGNFILTTRNAMQFENISIFSDYFMDFNRIASTGNDFNLKYTCDEIFISSRFRLFFFILQYALGTRQKYC
jgi:hypothetical protein